jgi:hypothetical protein
MTVISSEECFAAWAPDDSVWSEWAKPVAFVHPSQVMPAEPIDDARLPAIRSPLTSDSTVVVDLAGADAVYAGLVLAERGYVPVPLFNGTSGPSAVIDVTPITAALGGGALRLKARPPGRLWPPAFLLDARRNLPADPQPGSYDNRWVVLPQDLPSGAFLASRGIRGATLLQRDGLAIRSDLAHVLRRWQDNGIVVRVVDLESGQVAENVTVPKPSSFRLAWYAAIALLGLRRSNVGGFGSAIPEQTAHSGFHG